MRYKAVLAKKWLFLFLVLGIASGFGFQKAVDPKTIDVEHYNGPKIILGTEGGIIAMRNETVILRSGEVYYHNNVVKNDYRYLKTLNRKDVKRVFHLARNPGLPMGKYNHPGNMSTFLQLYRRQKLIKNFVWGEPGLEIPASLDKSYSGIINIIK